MSAWLRFWRKPEVNGFVFILPWLIGFLVFTAGSMLASLYISFHKFDLVKLEYVGVENYRRLLVQDQLFWKAFKNTLVYAIFSVRSEYAVHSRLPFF